jgi:hypothetical protein
MTVLLRVVMVTGSGGTAIVRVRRNCCHVVGDRAMIAQRHANASRSRRHALDRNSDEQNESNQEP